MVIVTLGVSLGKGLSISGVGVVGLDILTVFFKDFFQINFEILFVFRDGFSV